MSAGSTSYTYDAENRMTAVSGAATATFVYDGDGNRVKGVVGGVTTTYIGNYFEWSPSGKTTLRVQAGSTSTMKKYYYAAGTRVAERKGTTLYWLLSDHLGSTSITATSSGSKTAKLRYKACPLRGCSAALREGETRYTSGTTQTTIRYTPSGKTTLRVQAGQREESSLGLYWYASRWYSPGLGRFVSPDSIIPQPGSPQAWDRYSYVNSNPVRYTDPSGHKACEWDGDGNCVRDPDWEPGEIASISQEMSSSSVLSDQIHPQITSDWPETFYEPMSNYEIVGYRLEINWNNVDWLDVSLSGIGIFGDLALVSALATNVVGLGAYGVSEMGEFVGALGNLKAAYNLLSKGDPSGVLVETIKGGAKAIGLVPGVGSFFDLLSIGVEIGRNAYFVPVLQKKAEPFIIKNPPGFLFPLPPDN